MNKGRHSSLWVEATTFLKWLQRGYLCSPSEAAITVPCDEGHNILKVVTERLSPPFRRLPLQFLGTLVVLGTLQVPLLNSFCSHVCHALLILVPVGDYGDALVVHVLGAMDVFENALDDASISFYNMLLL